MNKDWALGEWWGGEVQVNRTLFDKHKIIAGLEYRDNFRQDQGNYDVSPFHRYLDDKRQSTIWAGYLQGEFLLRKDLRLNTGVRYDHYSTFGGTTNFRAALIYHPFDKTNLKLIYGTAFRAPNLYELYYHDWGGTQKANRHLNPE
jgi:outer membrane receptor for ferrienterochelin and colicins